MMLVPFYSEYEVFDRIQWKRHLKSPNVIFINQQSDLLRYSSGQKKGGYSSGTLYHTSKWKGCPPPPRDFNTIKYTKNQVVFRSASPFAPKWSNFLLLWANWCFASRISCFAMFDIIWAWWWENLSSGFWSSLDSIWSAQLQTLARSLKFLI